LETRRKRREEKSSVQGAHQAKHLTLSVCAIHIFLSVWTLICFVGGGANLYFKKGYEASSE
jgi:hypothetical protein